MGIALSDEIQKILPQISDAADVAMDNIFGNDDYIPYMAGKSCLVENNKIVVKYGKCNQTLLLYCLILLK